MRVLLIDDHALFREGLAELLKRRRIDTAAAANGRDGVRQAAALNPDVILLDLRMPEVDGLQTLGELKRARVTAPVVMLSTSNERDDLAAALRGGAKGYLLKDMEPDALVDALRRAAAGHTVVAPDLAPALAELVKRDNRGDGDAGDGGGRPPPFDALTPREMEILRHLSEGRSNKIIARHLGISDGTVKLHVQSVLRKLGLRSRVEAAVLAVENGLRADGGGGDG